MKTKTKIGKRYIQQVNGSEDAELSELNHWASCSATERLFGLEAINKNLWIMKYGSKTGFHRVHRVIEQREN